MKMYGPQIDSHNLSVSLLTRLTKKLFRGQFESMFFQRMCRKQFHKTIAIKA